MKNIFYPVIFLIILVACRNQEQKTVQVKDSLPDKTKKQEIPDRHKFSDTLKINYAAHKELLNILTLLPDSAMASWEWHQKDREKFVHFIAQNNYTVDTTEMYMTIKEIKPNTFKIQVVDGLWSLSIYKVKPENYIVITDDVVGDGNDIKCFEYERGSLKFVSLKDLFGDYFLKLLYNEKDTTCKELIREEQITFNYNFSDRNRVHIASSSLKEKVAGKCLKGNTMQFEFNPLNKNFKLAEIGWTNKVE
jgi:hypothetical protein